MCLDCIRSRRPSEIEVLRGAMAPATREAFGLPPCPPRSRGGKRCNRCVNRCVIGEGEMGFCGVARNHGGTLSIPNPLEGNLFWYLDPLPTNCVADWVCPGGTGKGYPRYAVSRGPEYGFYNLAVFFNSCTFDCLFCQNWHFKRHWQAKDTVKAHELVKELHEKVNCICYFGGDPASQMEFALYFSEMALKAKGPPIRICWETNGSFDPRFVDPMVELSLKSGGIIKFDLKAFDRRLHRLLTGADNRFTLKNFERIAASFRKRPEVPLLVASTLLVPGYMDPTEVRSIARFIRSLDPEIPYSLLAFHPEHLMRDLPATPKALAIDCYEVALGEGLKNVHLGNVHLLN
jgi:pyruvate formate lyase activating enzyme